MKLSSEILAIINIFPLKIWLLVTSFFFMATLFMLQERVVSNSMIDFVLGHFSSSFCFSSISFMLFFWIFSVSIFSLEKRLFSFFFCIFEDFFLVSKYSSFRFKFAILCRYSSICLSRISEETKPEICWSKIF